MMARGALNDKDISSLQLEMSIRRAESGLTYDALAKKSGVSRRTVISIETGTSRGSLDSWMRIYGALDCDFGAFLQELKSSPQPGSAPNLRPEMPLADYIVQDSAPPKIE